MAPWFYAVRTGFKPGVYQSWDDCKRQVDGFSAAEFKKFRSKQDAVNFLCSSSPSAAAFSSSSSSAGGEHVSGGPPQHNLAKRVAEKRAERLALSRKVAAPPAQIYATLVHVILCPPFPHLAERLRHRLISSRLGENSRALAVEGDPVGDPRRPPVVPQRIRLDEVPVVYTDGACSNNGSNNPVAGIGVYWGREDPRNVSEALKGKQTNNRAEIEACCRAIEQAILHGLKELEIRTDSCYVVNAITKWMKGWEEKGLTRSSGKAILNLDDLLRLRNLTERVKVRWKVVRGHAGEEGNEQADRLARLGAAGKSEAAQQ